MEASRPFGEKFKLLEHNWQGQNRTNFANSQVTVAQLIDRSAPIAYDSPNDFRDLHLAGTGIPVLH